jgi:hypothetical protein
MLNGKQYNDINFDNGFARVRRAFKEWSCNKCGGKIERLSWYYAIYHAENWEPDERVHLDCLIQDGKL